MTTSGKLLLGFGTLTALLVFSCAAILYRVRSIESQVQEMDSARRLSAAASLLEINAITYALDVRAYLHIRNEAARADAARDSDRVVQTLAEYERLAVSDRQRALAKQFAEAWRGLEQRGEVLLTRDDGEASPEELQAFYDERVRLKTLLDEEIQPDAAATFTAQSDAALRNVSHIAGFAETLMGVGAVIAVLTSVAVGRAVVRGERLIAEQGERLRTTLASIGDGVITTDVAGCVTHLNGVAESLTGWTNAEAAGQPLEAVFRIVNETTRQPVQNPATRSLREGIIVGLANHTVLLAKDGREHSIDDSAAPIRCKDGEVVGCVLIFRDVTAQRTQALGAAQQHAAAQMLAAIVDSSDDAIISKTLDGIIRSWNGAATRVFGYTPEQAIGRHITMLIPQERISEEDHIIARLRRGERVEHFDTVRVRSDGRRVDVALTISPIKDEAGVVIGASKIARDITERKQAESRLRVSEARSAAIVEAALDGVVTIDHEGKILEFNPAAERIFKLSRDEAVGREMSDLICPPATRDAHRQGLARYLQTGEGRVLNRRVELTALRSDGVEFPVEVSISPIVQDGPPIFTGHIRDITERKRAENELRQFAAELSEADRRKNEFLAMLSHEIRNPLAPIRSAIDLLRLQGSADASAVQQQAHEIIERQVANLTKIVSDLLEVSRVISGRIRLERRVIDINQVITHAVQTATPLIEQRGHTLTLNLCADGAAWADADPTRMEEVFINLLTNAAKYTEEGGRIEVWCEQPASEQIVQIRIRDNGLGISPELLPQIFDLFTQADRTLDRSQGGLGIGLSLARRLVEMHDGTIAVESPPADRPQERGSEFIVRLPATPAPDAAPVATPEPAAGPTPPGVRVLVVDDNLDMVTMLAGSLRTKGYVVQTASNGPDGLALAEAWLPGIILLDIGLPGLDGYEVARRIRASAVRELREARLIAVTGYGQDADQELAREAGFNAHVVKPCEFDVLERLIAGG